MRHWIAIAIAIAIVVEAFFAVAVVTALITRRTRLVFATGFNVMAVVGAMHLWHSGLGARGIVASAMPFIRWRGSALR